jgi:hypothetical protein
MKHTKWVKFQTNAVIKEKMALVFLSPRAVLVHLRSEREKVIQKMESNGLLEKC